MTKRNRGGSGEEKGVSFEKNCYVGQFQYNVSKTRHFKSNLSFSDDPQKLEMLADDPRPPPLVDGRTLQYVNQQ